VTHVLVVRPDGMGDVLLAGPAIRAVAAHARVTMLCSPSGAAAARRLPGVDGVVVARLPWIDSEPGPVDRMSVERLVARLTDVAADEALVLTSFHQSPLPTALVLRLAGVRRIGAISVDYPGTLLDVRHRVADDRHEVERNLSVAAAMGYALPVGESDELRLVASPPVRRSSERTARYVVVHPGASVPARTLRPSSWRAVVAALNARDRHVVVTGCEQERALVAYVCDESDSSRVTSSVSDDFDALVRVVRGADAIAVGNTGPAHVAAAVGTPVVSCHAPTVPAAGWHPWRVPHVLLGDQSVSCAGCRARVCPLETQRCLVAVGPREVVESLHRLGSVHVAPVTRGPAS
jgi:ADP-heptose:LPS heptosyltransferase